jgi:hypothetical protein
MIRISGKTGIASWTFAALLVCSNPAWPQTMGSYGGGATGGGGGGAGGGGGGIGTTSGGFGSSSGIGTGTGTGTSTGSATAVQAAPVTLYLSKTTGASSSNPIGSWYGNPLSAGVPNGTGKLAGIWAVTYTSSNTSNTITGNIGSSSLGGMTGQTGSTLNRRGPAYMVTLAFPVSAPSSSQLQSEAQKVIDQSTSLTKKDTIKTKMDGQTLVMEGQVGSDREKRLAENLVRLSGIRSIQNNLQIVQAAPTPRETP